MIIKLLNDRRISAYPVVGIPTAKTLNEIFALSSQSSHDTAPLLVYDHTGIGEDWNAHLKWLDENIATVRSIRSVDAAWQLAGWEE